VLTTS